MKTWNQLAIEYAHKWGCGYYYAAADIDFARHLYGEHKAYAGIVRLINESITWNEAFN